MELTITIMASLVPEQGILQARQSIMSVLTHYPFRLLWRVCNFGRRPAPLKPRLAQDPYPLVDVLTKDFRAQSRFACSIRRNQNQLLCR
jgi:hypothetical protein